MEIDSGNRQPDRAKEPVTMDTSVDTNTTKAAQNGKTEQPEQIASPSKPPEPDVAPGPGQPKDGDDPATVPEQSASNPPRPLFTQDVLSLYGLQPLVASVARVDPVTGEKKPMRKSYENHLRPFALSGRNKRHTAGPEHRLLDLVMWPEEEYQNQRVYGKDLKHGLPAEVMAKLGKAMQMRPGDVPQNDKWEELLGLGIEKVRPGGATGDKKGKTAASTTHINGQINGNRAGATTAANIEDTRPKRISKKRRYNDDSFEGYAEGFVDDADDLIGGPDGYSSEEHSRRGSFLKRRKKVGL